ncbi:hypothetical protein U1Q18_034737 [Sarracenia purpurea var. burkii]
MAPMGQLPLLGFQRIGKENRFRVSKETSDFLPTCDLDGSSTSGITKLAVPRSSIIPVLRHDLFAQAQPRLVPV